jgi:RNA polymerase sigma-70 factor (ECF subfamily)
MAGDAATTALKQLTTLLRAGRVADLTDGELLERFAERRDEAAAEAAFTVLVERHGPMVLRVCRQVLGDEHAAQDASQATFLVLARRAGAITRRDSVGSWLHGVALRVAAKARVAAARRRAHERRGGSMAAGRLGTGEAEAEHGEEGAQLHEELGRLPERFRTPLVLCYLEGLTQAQAATRLRCPLGTVQSRLARGREKLKARLEKHGAALPGLLAAPPGAAPAGWAEATVRAAMEFATGGGTTAAGSVPASAALATEVLRGMGLNKLRVALGLVLMVAVLAAGSALSARQMGKAAPPARSTAAAPARAEKPPAVPDRAPAPPQRARRVVRGVVRDEQGRPVAKAWVGSDPRPLADTWKSISPPGNLRESAVPFRDDRGNIVPAGGPGKYFERRDDLGNWHPVHPDDVRPFRGTVFGPGGRALTKKEMDAQYSPYEVSVAKGSWWMAGMPGKQNAVRTDAAGRFETDFEMIAQGKLHFASPDWTRQAIHVVRAGDPDRPLEIALKPTRLVRARVIETPRDDPKAYLSWDLAVADAAGKPGDLWQSWLLPNPNAGDPPHVKRRLEVRLPAGRYMIGFRSQTLNRAVSFTVPAGSEPLDLPDMVLESLASVRMVGKPAVEIDARDLAGRPVKLADFRGKVVVLDFWAHWCGPCVGSMPRLIALHKRFSGQPLVVLALHDASVSSPAEYRKAVAPLRERFFGGGDLPFRVLLDQAQAGKGIRQHEFKPGDKGSGRSADAYDVMSWPSTFVIGRDGKLVGKFDLDALEGVLEDQFGLPRSRPPAKAGADPFEPPTPRGPVTVKGQVVGPDGKPVAGAKVEPVMVRLRERSVTTGPGGEFQFTVEQVTLAFTMKVFAPGLAAKMFRVEPTGKLDRPLQLGRGVVVTGRVLHRGKGAPDIALGPVQVQRGMDHFIEVLKAKTDREGRFRFDHVFAGDEFWVYATVASLQDRGAIPSRKLRTGADGTEVNLGDLEVRPGRTLAGRVVFADGKALPRNAVVLISPENAWDLVRARLDERGRFEARGLPEGPVSVCVLFPDHKRYTPPGYRLSGRNKCRSPLSPYMVAGQLDRDVTDLTLLFEPGEEPPSSLDPGLLADFREVQAGTIAGAPPPAEGEK